MCTRSMSSLQSVAFLLISHSEALLAARCRGRGITAAVQAPDRSDSDGVFGEGMISPEAKGGGLQIVTFCGYTLLLSAKRHQGTGGLTWWSTQRTQGVTLMPHCGLPQRWS